jgi:hypothetical protein
MNFIGSAGSPFIGGLAGIPLGGILLGIFFIKSPKKKKSA